jgi:hypothetical protein
MSNTVEIKIEGLAAALTKIGAMPKEIEQAVQDGLMAVALVARNDAVRRVLRGPKTGRIYSKTNPKRVHQASAPGEAPATDLGALAGSILAEPVQGQLAANLVARMPYAVHLEYGTTRMAARPFMRPAADVASAQGSKIISGYVQKVSGDK